MTQLIMAVVIVAFDRGHLIVLFRSVFDIALGAGMFDVICPNDSPAAIAFLDQGDGRAALASARPFAPGPRPFSSRTSCSTARITARSSSGFASRMSFAAAVVLSSILVVVPFLVRESGDANITSLP